MTLETFRHICLSFPAATEQIQWGADLVFKVGGKMFAVAATEPSAHAVSFKCSDEGFAELLERDGVSPAPYMARAKWVALERFDSLPDREIRERLAAASRRIFAKLTKKAQADVSGTGPRRPNAARPKAAAKRPRAATPRRRRRS